MTAQPASLLLFKVGNGGSPESFATVGGLRITGITHNNPEVDATNLDSSAWRALLDGAGTRFVTITGTGMFTDSAAEEIVRSYAMGNQVKNYRLYFGNGDVLAGAFQITSYQRAGRHNSEENYALTLASSGPVIFTPG